MIFERLFAPLQTKNLTLKNRIIMTAFQTNFAQDGKAGARFREFYWKRAEGGAALLIVGGARFDRYGAAGHDFLSIENDSFLPELQLFTAGVHQRGAKTAIQLYHAGRYTKEKNLPAGEKALAPSAVYSTYTREVAKEASVEELQEVIRRWAEGADRAKRAGFDAVEIVGSAGYLISQFLSPLTNQRTDQYGGSCLRPCSGQQPHQRSRRRRGDPGHGAGRLHRDVPHPGGRSGLAPKDGLRPAQRHPSLCGL